MFNFKKQQKESKKKLFIGTYYNYENERDWALFVADDNVNLNNELKKFLKLSWDITIKNEDIIGVYPVNKEDDKNGNSYDIKLYKHKICLK